MRRRKEKIERLKHQNCRLWCETRNFSLYHLLCKLARVAFNAWVTHNFRLSEVIVCCCERVEKIVSVNIFYTCFHDDNKYWLTKQTCVEEETEQGRESCSRVDDAAIQENITGSGCWRRRIRRCKESKDTTTIFTKREEDESGNERKSVWEWEVVVPKKEIDALVSFCWCHEGELQERRHVRRFTEKTAAASIDWLHHSVKDAIRKWYSSTTDSPNMFVKRKTCRKTTTSCCSDVLFPV